MESNLCEYSNCSPKITIYSAEYNEYSVDDILIGKKTNSNQWLIIFHPTYGRYNFTDAAGNILKKACKQDITAALSYIKQNDFSGTQCDFYQNSTKSKGNITQVGNWYLSCNELLGPVTKTSSDILQFISVITILISLVFLGLIGALSDFLLPKTRNCEKYF